MISQAVLFLALLACSNAVSFNIDEECLNYTVYPTQYDITVIPYIYKDRSSHYDCEITIMVIANVPGVQIIELDSESFEILRLEVLDGIKNIINKYRPYEYNPKTGKLYLYLTEPLLIFKEHGKQYKINIMIRKVLTNDGLGIRLVPYEGDTTKHMILTRLSPHRAKHFFPCFDNPRFESGFKFRVYVFPTSSTGVEYFNTSIVIANEMVQHKNPGDGTIIIEYLPSPQVALYQVGFHYSTFVHRQSVSKVTNDTFVLWAPRNKIRYYDYLMKFSENILNLLIDYSQSHRPIVNGPINVVAVPSNIAGFEIGSWNLWTNGEAILGHDPQFSSIKQEELMKFDLTQHMSRVWLGNPGELSRTKWQEEWLKEGFATFMANVLLSQYNHGAKDFQQRRSMNIYAFQTRNRAMAHDWHHSTPALATFNRTLAVEIPDRYKELVTMKTASIIWMLENWVDSDLFHQSFVKFMNARRGLGISLEKLLKYIDLETVTCLHMIFNGTTASKILNSWFYQSGYPVIDVNVLRDRTPNVIQLKQHKFSFTPEHRVTSQFLIPIYYTVQKPENCLSCHRTSLTIDRISTFQENIDGGWIILNKNASGYYRVNYDKVTWSLIAKALNENPKSIDTMSRAQIVNDVFALYVAGEMNIALAFEILNYLDQEMEPVVWDSALSGYKLLSIPKAACNMTKTTYKEWQKFIRRKITPIYRRLWDLIEMDRETRLFRSQVIDFACRVDHEQCLQDMKRMFSNAKNNRQKLDPDAREACYYTHIGENGNFGGYGFNIFEVEDKRIAEHKRKLERNFLLNIPVGRPLMEKLVMSTSKTVTENPVIMVTPGKSKFVPGAAQLSAISYFSVVLLSAFILSVVR